MRVATQRGERAVHQPAPAARFSPLQRELLTLPKLPSPRGRRMVRSLYCTSQCLRSRPLLVPLLAVLRTLRVGRGVDRER